MERVTVSDWVLILTSIFLGAIALVVPVVTEFLRRKVFAPQLLIETDLNPPHCLKTKYTSQENPELSEDVFYFRAGVINKGQSQAKLVEAVLEGLWILDTAGKPHKVTGFSSINLHWAGFPFGLNQFVNINPERRLFIDIGHIASLAHQMRHESMYRIDIPGRHNVEDMRFMFEQGQYPLSQPNCLVAGKYVVQIVFYSENARSQAVYLQISWSGKWQDTEQEMFRELVLERISQPPAD